MLAVDELGCAGRSLVYVVGARAMVSGMKLRPLSLFRYIGAHVGAISAHVACVFGLKLGVVGLTMRALGFSWSAALAAGATLAQISEVSLFMVARAQQLGLLSRGAYLMVLATTVVLLAFGPLAVHAARWIDRKDFLSVDSESLTVIQRLYPFSRRAAAQTATVLPQRKPSLREGLRGRSVNQGAREV